DPNAWQAKKPPSSGKVAALITRVLGAARLCRRAARLGVSPRANCSSGCCGERRGVLRHGQRRLRSRGVKCWDGLTGTCPDQHAPVVIPGDLLCVEEFILEIIEGLLIQVKLALERPIRHTLALAQEIDNVIEEGVEVHPIFSARLKGMAASGCTVLYRHYR